MNKHNFTVYEYDRLYVDKELLLSEKNKEKEKEKLSKDDFKELRSFILKQEEGVGDSLSLPGLETEEATACMKLSANKYGQEILTVQNYVGTIMLSTGTTIEILPKLFKEDKELVSSKENARKLVVEMLKACGLITYKSFQNANLKYEKMPPEKAAFFLDINRKGDCKS